MNDADKIADLWATGKTAPYALFNSNRYTSGGSQILVEAIGGGVPPVIQRGEPIPADISERVSKQVYDQIAPVMLSIVDEVQP